MFEIVFFSHFMDIIAHHYWCLRDVCNISLLPDNVVSEHKHQPASSAAAELRAVPVYVGI